MADKADKVRKVWTKDETLLFLGSYKGRKEEFDHPRKKKTAFSHVLEDMIYQGFQDTSVTPTSLESKMRTLLQAYKSAKDNASRTGASLCPAPYMEELEKLFGHIAIIFNAHSLDVGIQRAIPLDEYLSVEFLEDQDYLGEDSLVSPPTSSSYVPGTSRSFSGDSSPSPANPDLIKKPRKSAKERYYDSKIEMKQNKDAAYKEYLQKKLQLREERDQRLSAAFQKLLDK